MDWFPFPPMGPEDSGDPFDSIIDSAMSEAMSGTLQFATTTTPTPRKRLSIQVQSASITTTIVTGTTTSTLHATLNQPIRTVSHSPEPSSSPSSSSQERSTAPVTDTSTQPQIKPTTSLSLPAFTTAALATSASPPESLTHDSNPRLEIILPIAIAVPVLITVLILIWLRKSRSKKASNPKRKRLLEPYPINDLEQEGEHSRSPCIKSFRAKTSGPRNPSRSVTTDENSTISINPQSLDEPDSRTMHHSVAARIVQYFRPHKRTKALESQLASMTTKVQNLEAAIRSAQIPTDRSPGSTVRLLGTSTEDQPPDYLWHVNETEPLPNRNAVGKARYTTRV